MFILLGLEATFLLRGAVAIQPKMAERNAAIEPERRMQFRVGINVGDVVYDDVRIYGEGINVAARLEGIAEAGGICVSGKVYEEISGRFDLAFQDMGEQQFKNIARNVRVYRVRLDNVAPTPLPQLGLPDKPSIAVLPFQNMSGDAEKGNELAPLHHSVTSSATPSSVPAGR